MIAKNKYFKPLIYSVVATTAIGMLALGLMFSAGALAWSLDPATPLYPRIGSILALIALGGFFGVIIFGLLWIIEAIKSTDSSQ